MVFLAILGVIIGLALFNGGGAAPGTSTGPVASPPKSVNARPALAVTRISPLTVTGRGFKSGERIALTLNGAHRKRVVATRAGRFNVRMGGAGRCNGGTIVAVGSKGSRAVANFSQLLCVSP
jgi:hypothetical protein